ncbi:MAG: DMT family transporter [Alphaproteobacteria bacterium]|nr:DMT family transporter [Alphaproteobacteria bacterium]
MSMAEPAGPADSPLAGIAIVQGAIMLFVLMDVAIKTVAPEVPLVMLQAVRYASHTLTAMGLRALLGHAPFAWPRKPGIQAARSLLLLAGSFAFALALRDAPLADVTAVNFLGPLLLMSLAARILGEKVGWHRWAAVGLGFVGTMIIVRPGLGVTSPSALFALVTACTFAVYQVLTRRLVGHDDALTTILHTGIAAFLVASLLAPFFWVRLPLSAHAGMAGIGAMSAISHYIFVVGYNRAPASLLAPFTYTQLLWAALFGVLFFGDLPDFYAVLGAAIIGAAGLGVIFIERRMRAEIAKRADRP